MSSKLGDDGAGTYDEALAALGTLISGKKRPDGASWAAAFESMTVHLERLGLKERLQQLSVVHVAGTKGKGSTCAMVEALLRSCGYKTGLFTSPHLCDVRERIRIDGIPVDPETFLHYFWPVFRKLKESSDSELAMPAYFRFLTMLGLHIFLEEGVDVVVLEVGLGGRLDATNCVPPPVVCAVTPLGYDHMDLLGYTLQSIATEKAGIFKKGSPVFTVPQPVEAMQALEVRAKQVGVPLAIAPPLSGFRVREGSTSGCTAAGQEASSSDGGGDGGGSGGDDARPLGDRAELVVGMQGDHQLVNASLAVQLAAAWEASPRGGGGHGERFRPELAAQRAVLVAAGVLPGEYLRGLRACRWPGRCEVLPDPEEELISSSLSLPSQSSLSATSLTFYLDGAHTPESMQVAAEWFAKASASPLPTASAVSPAAAASDVSVQQPCAPAAAAAPLAVPAMPAQRVLLFHCMEDRDAGALLPALLRTLQERGVPPAAALFVPPDSQYADLMKMGPQGELAWHRSLQRTYESQLGPSGSTAAAAQQLPLPALPTVPCAGGGQDPSRGAVLPSLRAALQWLRQCARQSPQRRVQVLVTGSLYLVGDMLRLLGRTP